MTEETVDSGAQVELESKEGPGGALREAREARNLTYEAVAKQLHIDVSLVRALEEDDYSRFAAPIFVTGHLRAYARLLGLVPEPLIESYQSLGKAAAPSLERVAHLNHQPEPSSSAQVPRWMVYVLAVAVIAVVVLIWHSEASKLLAPIMESPLMPGSSSQTAPGGEGIMSLPVPNRGEASDQSSPFPALADGKGDQNTSVAPNAPNTPQSRAPAEESATLDLTAEKPSWVEVKDGSGNRLFYDLMVPGDSQTLHGKPPFDILLGYAPGVVVEYNGKRVDHSIYARQDMARFRVGDKGTSKD